MLNTATKGAIAAVALAGLVLIGYNLVLIGVKLRKRIKKEDSTEQEKEDKKDALEIVNLQRTTVNRIEFKETRDSATHPYTGNVWNVVIINAFSNSISNCQAEAKMFRDRRNTGKIIPLRWQISREEKLPASCHYGMTMEKTEECNDVFAFC